VSLVARGSCVVLLALAACGRSDAPAAAPAPSAAGIEASKAPVDHLAPDELLEGTEKAFGITLPQRLRLSARVADAAYAKGPVGVSPLVHYFQARVQDGDLRQGDTSATFTGVHALGVGARLLSIHIAQVQGTTSVDIHDDTPPVPPQLPDDTERWKRVGLSPQGRILDPTHLD
jgi:hypothetical protein